MSPPAATARVDKRQAILDAALSAFSELGFHGTSVPELARRANVGAGTIYRYFDNKEALVNVLFRHWKMQMSAHFLQQLPVGQPFREQFRALWNGLADFAIEHPQAMAFIELHHHGPYLDEQSMALEHTLEAGVVEFIRTAQAQQIVADLDPHVLKSLVYGAFLGLVRTAREGRITLTPEVVAASEERIWAAIRR